ncbi:MAG: 2Fe-2S iron-sulfur cluster-binding protein, partial [Methanoregulaceae archaeon]|nr:2Fe-2S iron-sulfur cluster-binding protein [Methanoregulaceae archaeon]
MTVKVFRFDPETDEKPHFQTYLVRVNDGARVLHALHCIKEEHDPSLSY